MTEFENKVNVAAKRAERFRKIKYNDADNAFVDIMRQNMCSGTETDTAGIGDRIIKTWQNSKDRQSLESLFEIITGSSFAHFINISLGIDMILDREDIIEDSDNGTTITVDKSIFDDFIPDAIVNIEGTDPNLLPMDGYYIMVAETDDGIVMSLLGD